jgi:PHD/YefM family antitoxin component YafN of YafNO toxin-antitoxin module
MVILNMKTKTITSTAAHHNFGQILNDVVQFNTRYVIKRHNLPQAIMLSLADFEQLLADESAQRRMVSVVRELTPVYNLGEDVTED